MIFVFHDIANWRYLLPANIDPSPARGGTLRCSSYALFKHPKIDTRSAADLQDSITLLQHQRVYRLATESILTEA